MGVYFSPGTISKGDDIKIKRSDAKDLEGVRMYEDYHQNVIRNWKTLGLRGTLGPFDSSKNPLQT